MNYLRHIIAAVIAASLLVSAGISGYGRALAAGGQSMVICSGYGPRTALIGANGREMPMLETCDDCCIAVGLQTAPPPVPVPPSRAELAHFIPMPRVSTPAISVFFALARGPPAAG